MSGFDRNGIGVPRECRAANGIGRKSNRPKRKWGNARAKVEAEGRCRNCGVRPYFPNPLDTAHTLPRSRVSSVGTEPALGVIPLCRFCHKRADEGSGEHRLWLGPLLTEEELAYAVGLVGEGEAMRRLFGRQVANCDRLHCGDTIGPCDHCPRRAA